MDALFLVLLCGDDENVQLEQRWGGATRPIAVESKKREAGFIIIMIDSACLAAMQVYLFLLCVDTLDC